VFWSARTGYEEKKIFCAHALHVFSSRSRSTLICSDGTVSVVSVITITSRDFIVLCLLSIIYTTDFLLLLLLFSSAGEVQNDERKNVTDVQWFLYFSQNFTWQNINKVVADCIACPQGEIGDRPECITYDSECSWCWSPHALVKRYGDRFDAYDATIQRKPEEAATIAGTVTSFHGGLVRRRGSITWWPERAPAETNDWCNSV